jgi:hypothetical protein
MIDVFTITKIQLNNFMNCIKKQSGITFAIPPVLVLICWKFSFVVTKIKKDFDVVFLNTENSLLKYHYTSTAISFRFLLMLGHFASEKSICLQKRYENIKIF